MDKELDDPSIVFDEGKKSLPNGGNIIFWGFLLE